VGGGSRLIRNRKNLMRKCQEVSQHKQARSCTCSATFQSVISTMSCYTPVHKLSSPQHSSHVPCGQCGMCVAQGASICMADKCRSKWLVWSANRGHLNIVVWFVLSCWIKNREGYETTCWLYNDLRFVISKWHTYSVKIYENQVRGVAQLNTGYTT